MKAYVRWTRESEGVSEVEVDEAEVLDWVNEGLPEGAQFTDVTGAMVSDFLEAGSYDWTEHIDFDRDQKFVPWSEYAVDSVTLQEA